MEYPHLNHFLSAPYSENLVFIFGTFLSSRQVRNVKRERAGSTLPKSSSVKGLAIVNYLFEHQNKKSYNFVNMDKNTL